MSKIEKLSILGVRSFDPVNREAIQFNSPLTLIVGYNGSGKTTIIECLKYATTGELPPNSKGGAFIHDPKVRRIPCPPLPWPFVTMSDILLTTTQLCGEKEIMAQVKLSFRSTVGESYVVTRSLQLTVKKNTRSQKTLEGTLLCRSNGERTSISARVNELDSVVPEKLGVSQAILDAVIFCHQDESLWPMSEPSVLKKRFDEIFEAMRYTKAIENLKILRKKHGDELGKLKLSEEHDKSNKDKAEKAQRRMTTLSIEIDELKDQAQVISAEMDDTQQQSRDKAERANSSLRFVQDLQNKSDQLEFRQGTVAELRETIDEMHETDEFLENALSQYENRIARLQEEAQQSADQWKEFQSQLNSTRKSMSTKLAEQGKHQSDKEKHERQLTIRVGMIREAAQRHEIRGYDGDLDENQVRGFYDRLNRILQDKKRDLQRLQQENGRELDKLGGEIQVLEGRKQSRTQDRLSAKQRMEAIDKETTRRNSSIATLDIDEGSRAIQESRMAELEGRLVKTREDANLSGLDSELQQENDRLTQLETENEKLGRELVECTRLASDRAQLEYRKKELTERQRELDTRTNTWREKLAAIIGSGWTPATVEADFQGVLKRQQDTVADAASHREATQADLKQMEFRLTTARDKRKKAAEEETRSRSTVLKALESIESYAPIDEYLDELDEIEGEVVGFDQDLNLFDHLKKYYLNARKSLAEKNCCSLCDRKFETNEGPQKSKLEAKILQQLSDKEKLQIQKEKANAEHRLNVLKGVRPQYDSYQRASSELPSFDKEIKTFESQKDSLVRQLEQQDSVYKEAEEKRQDIDAMSKTVSKISQLSKDIAESEMHIERSASQLQLTGPIRTAEEIHELQTASSEQIRTVKAKVKKLDGDRRRMQELANTLALEQNELKNQIIQANQLLERKKDLEDEIQQLKNDYAHQREIVQEADRDLEALEPEITKARAIREDALQRGRFKETKAVEERDAVSSTASELKLIENDIQSYIESGGPANLVANQRSISQLEQTIANIEKDVQDATVQINKMKQEIANGDRKKKNIADNLNYRKNLRALEDLDGEINALKERNDQADYDRLIREKNVLDSHHNKLLAKRGSVMGEIKTKDQELARLIDEWALDYEGAAQKYRETHIKVETTKAAIEDLGRYSSALDKAIMQFHSMKMEEVNRIAGELWQSTYQGTDIDTILIRSDTESATGKRNYNYRLCMVKQDTEMDMRGRCSAGQKVLASIIIRLALAESFGINCGLIALDEPTTNLDSDNIRSLAESLHRIIKARQAQSNFQLIVITHDEEFLKHMQCSDFCDTFYRVRRDEKQNSIIRAESITKVME